MIESFQSESDVLREKVILVVSDMGDDRGGEMDMTRTEDLYIILDDAVLIAQMPS